MRLAIGHRRFIIVSERGKAIITFTVKCGDFVYRIRLPYFFYENEITRVTPDIELAGYPVGN